ncbi:endonuclease/exonuclease/phosphatase family protein [Streptomyces cavernicola]|uniref:Endonuclease/exonuclease/phosphatase family protein n=1 Tax=Streptomyces cavernicola TaxID=3043613 RepID=A0ABT6S571_9ACTN|nr:endonuclease/exonuclease/phosphatase family protein [Streptomyces sp. B-S-A6]MDI3403249.1 endonuclease/exonuclease/phosphatase family protein [Streptomyces sp. B-S-A6]
MAVALFAAVLLAPGGVASAADVPRLPKYVSVLSWNMCGAWDGCTAWEKPAEKVGLVVEAVEDDPSVAVVMLQEVCRGLHAEPLQERLGEGWQVQFRAAPVVPRYEKGNLVGPTDRADDLHKVNLCSADKRNVPPGGPPTDEAGVLVAMKKLPGSELHGENMSFVQDVRQGAACIKDTGNLLFACSSHFLNKVADPDEESRVRSGWNFRDQTFHLQAQGYRTVIGGDLNARPDTRPLQPLYEGNFEADVNLQRATHPEGKLDHVFFSDYGWDLVGASVDYPGTVEGLPGLFTLPRFGERLSDHSILKGVVEPVSGW